MITEQPRHPFNATFSLVLNGSHLHVDTPEHEGYAARIYIVEPRPQGYTAAYATVPDDQLVRLRDHLTQILESR